MHLFKNFDVFVEGLPYVRKAFKSTEVVCFIPVLFSSFGRSKLRILCLLLVVQQLCRHDTLVRQKMNGN